MGSVGGQPQQRQGKQVKVEARVHSSQVLPGGGDEHVGVERPRDALVQAVAQPQHAQRRVARRAQLQRVAAPQPLQEVAVLSNTLLIILSTKKNTHFKTMPHVQT